MPKVLEGSKYNHPHLRNIKLFAQPVEGEGIAKWYTRITFGKTTPDTKTEQSVRSLKIDYIPNDERNRGEAEEAARGIYYALDKRRQQGLTTKRQNLLTLIDAFLRDLEDKTKDNFNTPIHQIPGGTSFLDKTKLAQINHVMLNIVRPFFGLDPYKGRSIDGLVKKDIEAWSKWRQGLNIKWAHGTLNKQNRVFRSFFKWAVDEGYMFAVPEIKEFKTDIREARRPDMDDKQYAGLLAHIRKRYSDKTKRTDARVYQRLFYLYICSIDAMGIRPFNSEKNAIKHDDVKIKRDKAGDIESILVRRREKGKMYDAVADPQWASIYEDILAIQKAWGVESEYLFAHPIDSWHSKKNDPIKSFNTQWNKAVKELGWNKKGDRQKDRISKYSIRHRYAYRRYIHNQDISLEELAQVMGTSPTMIYKVYYHYRVEKNYKKLMAKGYKENKSRVKEYDDLGLPRL
jgi:hypothetical protein